MFKNIIKTTTVITLATASLFAQNYENKYNHKSSMYIGIGFGSGNGIQNIEDNNHYYYNYETNYDVKAISFKIGHIFSNRNRFEVSFNRIDTQALYGEYFLLNETDYKNSAYNGFDFDWLFTFRNNKAFQPYLLVGFGFYNNNDIHGYLKNTGEKDTARAVSLNGGIGFNYAVSNFVDFELAYKIKSMAWNIEELEVTDKLNMLYVGMNLKF